MMIDSLLKNWLEEEWGGRVKFDEPMSKHTSFRVGGPADVYAEPETREELIRLVRKCGECSLPFTVIGGGTNLLVKDRGIRGIAISMTKFGSEVSGSGSEAHPSPLTSHLSPFPVISSGARNLEVSLTVSAGMKLGRLCGYCIARGLAGMNFAVGIPGTVGGAVMMNAGTAAGSMQDVVASLEVLLSDGTVRHIKRTELQFAYRNLTSFEKLSDFVSVLGVKFCLSRSDPEKLKKEARSMMDIRRKKQPITVPSAGCFFKNPSEALSFCRGGSGKKLSAGFLIEHAGLKGKEIGGAQVSEKHANFIINRNSASAASILTLAETVRETVWQKFGIILETEVRIIGE
jgi:UDP-N-acetylmuramate dehydrogenase